MTCPALECRDESFIKGASLGPEVYGLGADDCEFQRFILGQLFTQKREAVPKWLATTDGAGEQPDMRRE